MVGQPLDTVKTRMQIEGRPALEIAKNMFSSEGVFGLYRGGLPLVLGGSLFRSAQFGVNDIALNFLRSNFGGPMDKSHRIFGVFDYHIIAAGFAGGIGRG